MNKLLFILCILLINFFMQNIFSQGGAIGLQLGKITFGIGGSSNGPIIGIGPSPQNNLPIALPFVPGDCNCSNCCP